VTLFRSRPAGVFVGLLVVVLLSQSLAAQEVARPLLRGRVVRGDTVAVPDVTVVLHRVAADTEGEIDSLRAGPSGEFTFVLPSVPDPVFQDDVYLAAVSHQGIMYFGPPIHQASQLDSVYLIQVHDTTMVPPGGASLPLILRYLILEAADDGWFVTDVIQLENLEENTLVASAGEPVWKYPLPPGAADLEVGQLDASPDAIALVDGSLEVSAPITPGVAQYMVRYRLEAERLELPLPGPVRQVELLVREPAPALTVRGLALNTPAEMEPGVTYRRYSAVEVVDAEVLVLPGTERRGISHAWLAVVMGMMLAGVTVWSIQRGGPMPSAAGGEDSAWLTARDRQESLLLEVAQLDERLESDRLGDGERTDLAVRREAVLEEIRRLA
jgi:hypothetical protein